MLDMDEPHEVNAAAGRFAGALETVADQVSRTVADLVPHHRPVSALDWSLHTQLGLMTTAFHPALAANTGGARNTHTQTVSTTDAYTAADVAGRAHVYGSESI